MTQIREGLSKADPKPMLTMSTEVGTPSTDKKPSPELFSLIKAAASNLMSFGELWNSIKKKGKDEGFSERELQDILRPLLKPQLNKDQIYYLFNKDDKIEQVKANTRRKFPTDEPKKVIEEKPISPEEPPKEDPLEIENEFLKEENANLKDAMSKMEQFKPATQLQEVHLNLTDPNGKFEEAMFNSLKKQADGVHSFYYDAYGIDLFRNRELSQLKNSGVKVFRRLYFEV